MALSLLQVFGLGNRDAYPGARLRKDGEIRVLKRKNVENGRISCKLTHINLSPHKSLKADYYALSYRWGDLAGPRIIYCNGAPFNVQKGLYAALTQIWSRTPDMLIWVDAICIDQTDVEERSKQVRMMGPIYRKALGVLIWLGEADPYTELAWSALEKASKLAKRQTNILKSDLAQIGPIENVWFSLHKIARREWFYRAWTFQELYLAQHAEVLCSQFEMDWNTFHHALEFIAYYLAHEPASIDSSRAKTSLHKLLSSVEKLWFSDTAFTLTELLVKTIHRDCDDPRDKIYALLGVLFRRETLWIKGAIEVDYRMSPKKLYTSVAHSLACRAKWTEPDRSSGTKLPNDLHILHGAGLDTQEDCHQTNKDPNVNSTLAQVLPSWVIDWTNSEATAAWADRVFLRRAEWRPIIRTDGIKLGAAINTNDRGDQGNDILLYGVVIARLARPRKSTSAGAHFLHGHMRLELEDLPRCSYEGKSLSADPFSISKTSPWNYTRWTSRIPKEDETRYPKDTPKDIYDSVKILRSLPSHDRESCGCSQTPYFHTIISMVLALFVSVICPVLTNFFFLCMCLVAYKDSKLESGKSSRNFCVDINVAGGHSTNAAGGDWIVSLAGEQGLFLLKPRKGGKFELVRGLLRHEASDLNWNVSRMDSAGNIESSWTSAFHDMDGKISSIPSWQDFRVLPVALTIR